MNTIKFSFDLYGVYDRLMDGICVPLEIKYDPEDIKLNGVTPSNLYLNEIVTEGGNWSYIKAMPLDIERIKSDIKSYFDRETLIEVFGERSGYDELYSELEQALCY